MQKIQGVSTESNLMIYEFQDVTGWRGCWYGAKPGELGAMIRKYRPVKIVRIR